VNGSVNSLNVVIQLKIEDNELCNVYLSAARIRFFEYTLVAGL